MTASSNVYGTYKITICHSRQNAEKIFLIYSEPTANHASVGTLRNHIGEKRE